MLKFSLCSFEDELKSSTGIFLRLLSDRSRFGKLCNFPSPGGIFPCSLLAAKLKLGLELNISTGVESGTSKEITIIMSCFERILNDGYDLVYII